MYYLVVVCYTYYAKTPCYISDDEKNFSVESKVSLGTYFSKDLSKVKFFETYFNYSKNLFMFIHILSIDLGVELYYIQQ